MDNELSNFGQGFHPPSCIYSYWGMMGKILDPTFNIHISCDIRDTVEGCRPMNYGHLWICLVGITPSNNQGTKMELLPYMVGNSPALPYMVMGNPTGHGIQFQGKGILCNYLCQRSTMLS